MWVAKNATKVALNPCNDDVTMIKPSEKSQLVFSPNLVKRAEPMPKRCALTLHTCLKGNVKAARQGPTVQSQGNVVSRKLPAMDVVPA